MPTQTRTLDPLADLLDPLLDALADRVAARITLAEGLRPRLLTVKQAAAYLARTEKATYQLIAIGSLPSVRSDARVMLDRQDLDQWIDSHKEGPR